MMSSEWNPWQIVEWVLLRILSKDRTLSIMNIHEPWSLQSMFFCLMSSCEYEGKTKYHSDSCINYKWMSEMDGEFCIFSISAFDNNFIFKHLQFIVFLNIRLLLNALETFYELVWIEEIRCVPSTLTDFG